jgi:hypothetical protein
MTVVVLWQWPDVVRVYSGVENSLEFWSKSSRENAFSSRPCQTSELSGAVHRAGQGADIAMISYAPEKMHLAPNHARQVSCLELFTELDKELIFQ